LDALETSKTRTVYLLLKERITSGVWSVGQRLPSEPRLAAAHGLSRVTIRRALDGLARDGLILRQPGAGTFVRGQRGNGAITGDFANMLQSLLAMGKATRVKLIAFNYVVPPPAVAEALDLAAGERAQHSLRVRMLDDAPFSYLSTYVPERIGVSYSEADLASQPLLSLLERSGVVAVSADQTLSATLAGPDSAAALDVPVGSALIAMTRVVRDANGRGVEHLSALYRPDRHQFHMALTREGQGAERHWRPTLAFPTRTAGRRNASPARRTP
jgi:GntR family transcriptional regulator